MEAKSGLCLKNPVSALMLVWIFALLPAPLVWIGFYQLHSYVAAILLYGLGCCLLPCLLFLSEDNRIAFGAHFGGTKTGFLFSLSLSFLVAALLLAGWFVFSPQLIDPDTFRAHAYLIQLNAGSAFRMLAIYFVLINPVLEEFFWRGLFYPLLKNRMPQITALLISSLFFGGWHWMIIQHFFQPAWQIPITFTVVIGGLIFGWLSEKTGSLTAPVLVHGLGTDLPIMLMLWDALHRV